MRARELQGLLQNALKELAVVTIGERPRQSGAFFVDELGRLRAAIADLMAHRQDLPPKLRSQLRMISSDNLFRTGVPDMPTSSEEAMRLKGLLLKLSDQLATTLSVVTELLAPATEYSLQVLLPPSVGTLSELASVVSDVQTFVGYPTVASMGEEPKLHAVEPGSVWLVMGFATPQGFLMALGCLGVFFSLMAGVLKVAQAAELLQRVSRRLEIGEDFLKEALKGIKETEARPQLEALAREFAPNLDDASRQEWITHLLEVSFSRYRFLIEEGMRILYSAEHLNDQFRKTLPLQFSLEAIQQAALKPQPSLPPAPPDSPSE